MRDPFTRKKLKENFVIPLNLYEKICSQISQVNTGRSIEEFVLF